MTIKSQLIAASVSAVVALSAANAFAAPAPAAHAEKDKAAHQHHRAAVMEKGPTVTLGGVEHVQLVSKHQTRAFDVNADDQRLSNFGIVNDTKVHVKVDGQGHGFKYGGKIVFNADTSNSKENESSVAHQTSMYVKSSLGMLEAGSTTGVYEALQVNGASIARATGGIDGDAKFFIHQDIAAGIYEVVSPGLLTTVDKSYTDNASKVSYYTPSMNGFKAGISYIPDTDQHGTITNLKGLAKDYTTATNAANLIGYKNVVQGGLKYKGTMNKVTLRAAVTGETGDAKKAVISTATHDREDLRAFEAGASLQYMGFSVAGSYGSNGKSGLSKSIDDVATEKRKSGSYFTAGLAYVHHHFGASLGFADIKSARFVTDPKLRTKAYSFGVDYKLAPGFMPYAEVTRFDIKSTVDGEISAKNKATVGIIGTKLHF